MLSQGRFILVLLFSLMVFDGLSQTKPLNPPGLKEIKAEDLKKDLFELSADHFMGRSAGNIDELKAAVWIAKKYQEIGLIPAGDDGTFFQFFNLWRNRISSGTQIQINQKSLTLWKDVSISQMARGHIEGPILYLGNASEINFSNLDIKGKVVALEASQKGINLNVSLPTWRYSRYIMTKYGNELIKKGATAVLILADEYGEKAWDDAAENFKRGLYDVDGGPNTQVSTSIPVLWVHQSMKPVLMDSKAQFSADIQIERFQFPSVNIVGMIKGTDPLLSKQYLLLSGHTDAHGVRNPIQGDSIYHGADDNASVDVAILASARAYKKFPGKRSVLVVIHGAEERGLLGSRWYSSHPTVPIQNIVAVLNGDMIGRNNTDSAALLGINPPHRNSKDLIQMALLANQEGPKFKLDTLWDQVSHIEGWYFRSDHLPYARLGIPSIMYSSLLHPDYHTPQDNAENINLPKLKKMADWLYRTGWKVLEAPNRPALDPNFKLER